MDQPQIRRLFDIKTIVVDLMVDKVKWSTTSICLICEKGILNFNNRVTSKKSAPICT